MRAVAIDGPAGAGKSTIARTVAGLLGYIYVDTGALYRAIGLFATRNGIAYNDEQALDSKLKDAEVELCYQNGVQCVLLGGEDVSQAIRSPEMSKAASAVSALSCVREYLFHTQQRMAETNNVIMDGRDIGTVVLPNADVKIYLTASVEARAKRRYDEYIAKGEEVSYNTILMDMQQRDYNDTHRAIAPLRQADDAVLLDTSGQTVEQSVELVLNLLKKRGIA